MARAEWPSLVVCAPSVAIRWTVARWKSVHHINLMRRGTARATRFSDNSSEEHPAAIFRRKGPNQRVTNVRPSCAASQRCGIRVRPDADYKPSPTTITAFNAAFDWAHMSRPACTPTPATKQRCYLCANLTRAARHAIRTLPFSALDQASCLRLLRLQKFIEPIQTKQRLPTNGESLLHHPFGA